MKLAQSIIIESDTGLVMIPAGTVIKEEGDWPESDELDEGSFTEYCKEQGFEGPCIECAELAKQSDDEEIRGKAAFYMNTVKPKGKDFGDI